MKPAPTLKQLKYIKEIQDFVKGLEKGDLVIDQNFQYGFGLYGQSKAGKTSTSHLLAGNVLTGKKINGSDMVQATTTKFKQAKIGNTGNSQTQIPNVLKTSITGQEYFLLDTPGYGDTYGVLRIFANAFYHYRLYSKVKNMKFIITFDKNHFSNTADKLVDTIVQFTSYFKNYASQRKNIWKSCCFLITKIDEGPEAISDIKSRLLFLVQTLKTQLTQEQDQLFRDFLKYIVSEDRIFTIKSVSNGQIIECKGLLERINKKVQTWWRRQIVDGIVDMKPIAFSLGKQINIATAKADISKIQFKQLLEYYNIKIAEILQIKNNKGQNEDQDCSFEAVVNQLVNDTMVTPQSHNFLKKMQAFIKKNYDKYDSNYIDVRQKKQQMLFALETNAENDSINSIKKNAKDKNYVIKKFKALQQIQILKRSVNSINMKKRDITILNLFQETLYKIVKQLNRVCFKKVNCINIIYKYGYLIHRIIEQCKIFVLLLQIEIDPEMKKTLLSFCNNKGFDIERQFMDFMGVDFHYDNDSTYTYQTLHQRYVQDFVLTEEILKKININGNFLEFFSDDIQVNADIAKKINTLILTYSDRVIKESHQKIEFSIEEKKKLMVKLMTSRINSEKIINDLQNQQAKNSQIILLRRLTQNLGQLLQISQQYQLAKTVYKSIHFVDNVCNIFQIQIKEKPNNIKLRIGYSKYLQDHFRQVEAMKLLQKTFQIVKYPEDLQMIKNQIMELRLKMKSPGQNIPSEYQQETFDGIFFKFFDNYDIQSKILEYASYQ